MHAHAPSPFAAKKKLALVGNPNVGKSVVFGALTGRYATVSNYPGTTVEVSRGVCRMGGEAVEVIDTPGVNSLVPMSEDERVTRDILLNEDVGGVLHIIDAKNLRRGLLITFQLAEMGLPVTVALNMYDEAGERGITIDMDGLAASLGLSFVPTIATQRWNVDKLKDSFRLQKRAGPFVRYHPAIEDGINGISSLLPPLRISARSIAIMLLSGDETITDWLRDKVSAQNLKDIEDIRAKTQTAVYEPAGYSINIARFKAVDEVLGGFFKKEGRVSPAISQFLGNAAMHPLWGIPILIVVLTAMYEFVGVLGAGVSVDFFEEVIFGSYLNPWVTRIVSYGFPEGLIHDLIVGQYGIVTMAVTYAIAIVLPIVGFFFIFFSILEDSGYLPRLAIMVDRVFKLMGLNGKAVLPMVLGLGCDTMATMTTRILETKKERVLVTLLLALGVPCSAQLGVILGMLGSVSAYATAIWASSVIIIIFLVGFIASKVLPGEPSDFIIEIPPVRLPQISNIALKTLVRVEWYLKEALPLFVLGTAALFILDKSHALAYIERMASPVVVGLLDLPKEAAGAFIVGFLRRDYGAAGLLMLQKNGKLDGVQVAVSLVTITLFIPCIANLFMIIKERGAKAAFWMTAFIFPFAFAAGGALNFILRALGARL